MLSWGSRRVWISIRGLNARERSNLSIPHPLQPRCTLSLVSGENSWICYIQVSGGYDCPLITSDGMPPVRHPNGRTDRRGTLTLDHPLAGTHPARPLAWQVRYPHVDGFILPWTRTGSLRPGVSFNQDGGARHYRGTCSLGSQHTHAKGALRCYSDVQFDPCFAPPGNWNRRGAIVACASAGWTSFGRFVIVRRSS